MASSYDFRRADGHYSQQASKIMIRMPVTKEIDHIPEKSDKGGYPVR